MCFSSRPITVVFLNQKHYHVFLLPYTVSVSLSTFDPLDFKRFSATSLLQRFDVTFFHRINIASVHTAKQRHIPRYYVDF